MEFLYGKPFGTCYFNFSLGWMNSLGFRWYDSYWICTNNLLCMFVGFWVLILTWYKSDFCDKFGIVWIFFDVIIFGSRFVDWASNSELVNYFGVEIFSRVLDIITEVTRISILEHCLKYTVTSVNLTSTHRSYDYHIQPLIIVLILRLLSHVQLNSSGFHGFFLIL